MTNRYTLPKPCADCPFRSDKPFYLHPDRVDQIADALLAGQEFHCHKTIDYTDDGPDIGSRARVCAGALITAEKGGDPEPQMLRIAGRLGLPVAKLDLDQPTYDSIDEWREAMKEIHP